MVPARIDASVPGGPYGRSLSVLLSAVLLAAGCSSDGGDCLDTLTIVVTTRDLYSNQEFEAEARWAAGGGGCPDDFTWTAEPPLSIVGSSRGERIRVMASEAGTGRLSVSAGPGAEFAAARDVDVLSSTGWALVTIEGLADGVPADIVLTGPAGESARVSRDSTVGGLVPGIWTWQINTVTGGIGHRWVAVNPSGTFTILRNTPTLLPLAYRRVTAQIDFAARNVPFGTIGDFVTLTRDGGQPYTFVIPEQSIAVEPGHFTWTANAADERGYWYVPRVTSGEFTLLPEFTIPFIVEYDAQRGFLDIRVNGLPPGVVMSATLLDGGNVHTVSLPGAGYRSPAEYALDVPELTDHPDLDRNRYETYRAVLPTRQISLIRGTDLVVVVDMYLARWQASFMSAVTIANDPFDLAPLIGLPPTLELRVTVTQPAPGEAATAAAEPTIAIIGPPPWVTVIGALTTDTTFTASGTGTVAGYPGVPVRFNGRLQADGGITGTLELGSDTPPTGLPGGTVRMNVGGDRLLILQPAANGAPRPANTPVDRRAPRRSP